MVLNPPFKYSQDFLRHALEIGAPFAQLMLATSFCSIGVRDALGDTPFDVVLLPRQHKFKHDGRMVSIHACVWLVVTPQSSGRVLFASD